MGIVRHVLLGCRFAVHSGGPPSRITTCPPGRTVDNMRLGCRGRDVCSSLRASWAQLQADRPAVVGILLHVRGAYGPCVPLALRSGRGSPTRSARLGLEPPGPGAGWLAPTRRGRCRSAANRQRFPLRSGLSCRFLLCFGLTGSSAALVGGATESSGLGR